MTMHTPKPIESSSVGTDVEIVIFEAPNSTLSAVQPNGSGSSTNDGSGDANLAPNGGGASGTLGNGSAGLTPNGGGASGTQGNGSGG